MIHRRVTTEDGVSLALYRARAFRDGRPGVLLVHGAFSNHRLWLGRLRTGETGGGLVHFLTERGLDVWLADLRHHGASDREPAPGRWSFTDWIHRDAPALVARVREETGGAPLAWVGHSAGGAIGLCWLAREAPPGALGAIVTFGTPGPREMSLPRRALAVSTIALARALGRFPARLLRLGSEDEAAGILAEWMGWNARGGWVGTDGFDYLAALRRLTTPFLSVAGAGDRLFAPPHACRQLVDATGAAAKELVVCGARLSHRGLLRDPRARERCWPRVATWLEDILAA